MKLKPALFLIWTLQGLAACAWLALLPTDAEHGLIFGYSASRLLLLAALLALTAGSAGLAAGAARRGGVQIQVIRPLYWLSISMALAAPIVIVILSALGKDSAYTYGAYAGRLAPLACWLGLGALELAASLAPGLPSWQEQKRFTEHLAKPAGIALVILALLAVFAGLTGWGITRTTDGSWGAPATPLLEWQILLALAAGLTFLALETRWAWLKNDRIVAPFMYALTCLLWLSQKVNPGYFATPPRAPNFQIYPFSDALIYAQYARSALVGNGFMWPDVPTRPLYITFLTWLHALAGPDYTRVILLQTLVLALFPLALYFFGRELAGRPLGVGLALLAALRDITANVAAPFALNYTYTKLFFSEIPTALLLVTFTILALRWLRTPQPGWRMLLAGGVLGLAALTRLQSAVLLAALFPLALLIQRNPKRWLAGALWLLLGLALTLMPWLLRNRAATGGIVLDNPISQTMVLARRWGGDNGNDLIPKLPGEGDAAYSSRMTSLALSSLRAHPGQILGSAANHFLNNEIGNLLVFPLRDRLESPGELLWPGHAFWQGWDGHPSAGQLALIAFYLLLLGIGLASAWRRNGPVGLLPLALSLVYNAWTALFLSSGDRFLVPMDWAAIFYLFLGLLTLARLVIGSKLADGITSAHAEPPTSKPGQAGRRAALAALVVTLLGAALPLTEMAFPRQYPPLAAAAPGEAVIARGRAVYPRWYAAGDGEPGSAKLGYGAQDDARLVFFLVGERNTLVILPMKKAPTFFPDNAEVVINATQADGYLQAGKIVVTQNGMMAEYAP